MGAPTRVAGEGFIGVVSGSALLNPPINPDVESVGGA